MKRLLPYLLVDFRRLVSLLELGVVLVMGEGGAKQALVDLGSLPNQLLHGFSLPPGLFGQSLERYTIILSLLPQGFWRGLDQVSGELEGLLLKREGVLYSSLVGCLGGLENLLKILLLPLAVHHFVVTSPL